MHGFSLAAEIVEQVPSVCLRQLRQVRQVRGQNVIDSLSAVDLSLWCLELSKLSHTEAGKHFSPSFSSWASTNKKPCIINSYFVDPEADNDADERLEAQLSHQNNGFEMRGAHKPDLLVRHNKTCPACKTCLKHSKMSERKESVG